MTTKIFAIRSKLTGEFLSFGSKCAWLTEGYAKMAFAHHTYPKRKFDEQDEYEVIDLTEAYYRLEGLDK